MTGLTELIFKSRDCPPQFQPQPTPECDRAIKPSGDWEEAGKALGCGTEDMRVFAFSRHCCEGVIPSA